jgi:hypothetical protein
MRVADVLREFGRPIAYCPYLGRYVGGVNAAVLFYQLFYWQDKATQELGVHKTVEELETGLSYEERRAAHTKLRACGVLMSTIARWTNPMPQTRKKPRRGMGNPSPAGREILILLTVQRLQQQRARVLWITLPPLLPTRKTRLRKIVNANSPIC